MGGSLGRSSDCAAHTLQGDLRLAGVGQPGQRIDLLQPDREHLVSDGIEGSVVGRDAVLVVKALERDLLVDAVVRALERRGGQDLRGLEGGGSLEVPGGMEGDRGQESRGGAQYGSRSGHGISRTSWNGEGRL
jgi:hypothetical protein